MANQSVILPAAVLAVVGLDPGQPITRAQLAELPLPLPNNPNLEQLGNLAKTVQRLVRAGDPGVQDVACVLHPRPPAAEGWTRADAQLVVARLYGFASWPRLREHIAVVNRYSRAPRREPAHGDLAGEFLRLACLTFGTDDPARPASARRLLADHPWIATADIYVMAAIGDVAAAADALARDPSRAQTSGGPFDWEPLLYAAYSRIDSTEPGHSTLGVARLLLEHGADANAGFLWEGLTSPFTALTGVFGKGEGNQPPHRDRLRFARLLLEHGADPNDSQTMYNCSLPGLDAPGEDNCDQLRLLLEFGLGEGTGGVWHARLGQTHPTPTQLLEGELFTAAERNLIERARLVIEAGVDVNGRGYLPDGGLSAYAVAVQNGNTDVADLLAEAGAEIPATDDPVAEFVSACMRADRAAVDQLCSGVSNVVEDTITTQPDLVSRAAGLGRVEAVRLMTSLGFDVNAVNRTTALHEAAWRGDLTMTRTLIELGADPSVQDTEHHAAPLGWARFNHRVDVAEYLDGLAQRRSASRQDARESW